MAFYKQSTAYTRNFFMVSSTDHIAAKTGITPTVNLSKAGGAFAAAGGTVTEVANGWYKIVLTTTDTNTLGDLVFHITGTGADDSDFVDQVYARTLDDLAFPTTSGRSMDVTATGEVGIDWANIGAPTTAVNLSSTTVGTAAALTTNNDKTGYSLSGAAIQAIWDALTSALTTAGSIGKLLVDNINATISSRLASASITLSGGAVTVGTNNDKTGYSIAAGGIGSGAHAAAELNAIADATLDRNMATGTDSGTDSTAVRTMRQALRSLRNKVSIAAGTMIVTKEDDTTASFTAAVTTAAGNPLSAVDPT